MTRAEDAVAWRRARDRREPLKRDAEAEQRALVLQFLIEALEPAAGELDACLMSLDNGDVVGAAYHFRRIIVALKQAAHAFAKLGAT